MGEIMETQNFTYEEIAQKILKEEKKPLGGREIWKIAKERGLKEKHGETPWKTIDSRMATMSKEGEIFYRVSKGKYYLIELKESLQTPLKQENKNKECTYIERDLHPLLVKFLKENKQFNLYCKTIYHEQSIKGLKGLNKWDYPDIVGVHFSFDDNYDDLTLNLRNMLYKKHNFYSFELKVRINSQNLKEYYFQAISNSSWANEGYLVVFEKIEEDIFKELRRLNESFGIGVICLKEKEVKLQAKYKEIDLSTIDMLIKQNPNFKDFMKAIIKVVNILDKTNESSKPDIYDKILSDEELIKHCKEHNIEYKI
ncbi:HTH domain-containing protein [Campylobacter sp. LR196d]|uniref:HTH domain-containing protein n=1 Tax=Campylobacter sp. LR196d TaxID=2593543 RepID=UPI001CC1DEDB|nr:HTH domain-containing protein [Campylobacter sp. LR196d]